MHVLYGSFLKAFLKVCKNKMKKMKKVRNISGMVGVTYGNYLTCQKLSIKFLILDCVINYSIME